MSLEKSDIMWYICKVNETKLYKYSTISEKLNIYSPEGEH